MTDMVQALSYASIILSEGGKEVTEENIKKLMDAAGIVVDQFVLSAFAKAVGVLNVKEMVNDFGSAPVGGGAPAAGAAAAGDAPAAAAEPEEEEEEESSAAAGDQYCVVKDSALVGVYSSADEAKSAMVSFSGNTQRATFVVSNGVLNTDPHKVADSQGNLQKDGGTWNRLWWDWNSINAMAAVAQGSSECTTGTAQETRVGQDIEQRVKEVIADQLGFDASEIRLDDKPLEDLGGTDWDMGCPMCEIWMTLEEEFNDGYPFEGDYETEAVTVQDMIDVVENAQKGLKREVNVGSNEVKNQDMSLSIQVPRPSDYVLLPLACVGVFSMVRVALGKYGFQDKTYKGVQAEVEDV